MSDIDLTPLAHFLARQLPMRLTVAEASRLRGDLGEYSCSLPSGTTAGKRWLCHQGVFDPRRQPGDRRWYMGEYGAPEDDSPGRDGRRSQSIPISWMRIEFVDANGNVLDNQDPELR